MASLGSCQRRTVPPQVSDAGAGANPGPTQPRDSSWSAVWLHDRDIWVRLPPDTTYRRLTHDGLIREGALSPDSQWVAYVRDTPGDTVEGGAGPVAATEIWLVRANGTGARMLLRGHDSPAHHVGAFTTLRFSPDGKILYFSSEAAAVSNDVHAVTTDSGREFFVCPGSLADVVPRGRYGGDLIIGQHRYSVDPMGSFDGSYLFTPDCREIMKLSSDSEGGGYDSTEVFYKRFVPPPSRQGAIHDPPPN